MDNSSSRDCEDVLFAREICCPIVSKFFFLLLEMRDLDNLKSKLEIKIIMKIEENA